LVQDNLKIAERFRILLLTVGISFIPIFFLPLTPDDPFLVPKRVLMTLIACCLFTVLLYPSENNEIRIPKELLFASTLLLICFSASLFGNANYHEGLIELKRWASLLVVFLSAASLIWSPFRLRMVLIFNLVTCVLVASYAILEYFEIYPFYLYPFFVGRLFSFFGHQNILAQYLAISIMWNIGLITNVGSKTRATALALIGVILPGTALIATYCRGSIIATVLGMFYFLYLARSANREAHESNMKIMSRVIFFFLVLFGLFLLWNVLLPTDDKNARLVTEMLQETDSYRLTIWKDTLRMIFSSPLNGVGIGNYLDTYPAYKSGNWSFQIAGAYNLLLYVLSETGIIGLFGLFLFAAAVSKIIRTNALPVHDISTKFIFYGISSGCIVALINSMVDNNFHETASSYFFWVGLGILCSKRRITDDKRKYFTVATKVKFTGLLLTVLLSLVGIYGEYLNIGGHYCYSQALVAFKTNRFIEGIAFARKAIKYQPYNSRYQEMIARKYLEMGDVNAASKHYRIAQELHQYRANRY